MRRAVPLLLSLGLLALGGAAPASAAGPDPKQLGTLGIGHVFVINIENKSFDEAYVSNRNPYLPKQLRRQGVLLNQYYGIGHLSLTNYIAQLSGQAPNAATQSDCQLYVDQLPGGPGPDGQSLGQGCVYPAGVQTLPDQLSAIGRTWRGYMEDMGNDPAREDNRCGAPTLGARDGTQSATATDQYAARHNPFVYFHSIVDSPACQQRVVPLTALQTDLATVATTASFNYITPNLCNDGHDDPCVGKNVRGTQDGGLVSADYWLQKYVPMIMSSPAFKKDGVLIITSDESENSDATACCNEQPGYNTPLPGNTGPGGGLIGTLVLGRCVRAGSTATTPYNHYSLLRSLEDMLGVKAGGADGKGHLGYAGAAGLAPFGPDVFQGSCGTPTRAAPVRLPLAPAPAPEQLPRTGGAALALVAGLAVTLALAGRRLTRQSA
jgi:hypothetical protein